MELSFQRALWAARPVALLGWAGVWLAPPLWAQSLGPGAQPSVASPALPPVVVTATRNPVPRADLVADVRVIGRELLEQSAGLSLVEVLRQHAGVQISSNGGQGQAASVFIRGTEARHVLLLIDGVRYGSATLGIPNWSNLPLAAIERIEVLKGPAAALYGSDAVGGVVQIFTRSGEVGVPRPYASLTLGGEGRREASAGLSGGSPQLRYAFGVSSLREDGFSATNAREPFGNFHPDRDGFEQQAAHGQVQWQVNPRFNLGLNFMVATGDFDFDSGLAAPLTFGQMTTRTLGLQAQQQWSPNHLTRLHWSRADDLTRNQAAWGSSFFDTTRQQALLQHEITTPLGRLTLGLERTREEVESSTAFTVRQRDIDGLFVGLQGAQGAHRWQAHVRQDDNSLFGRHDTWSLGYGLQLAPAWSLHASTGTNFKAPTFNQLFFPRFGNPSTQPERGRSHELGLSYERSGYWARVSYFEQDIRGFITAQPAVVNIPRVDIDGWSLSAGGTRREWRWSGNLELLDARNRTPGANFGRALARRADQQLTLNVERAVGGWWLGAQALLASERYDDPANRNRLPGYGVLSLSAETALAPDWTLRLRAHNLGDQQYETALGFNQPGRTLFATVTWQPQR